MVMH
jgi:serine/threonine protein kinase